MKILFVWPSKSWFSFKSMSIALFSAMLKQSGHEVALFDTTFYDIGYNLPDNTSIRTKMKIFKPVDLSQFNLSKKVVNLKQEFNTFLNDFQPDIIAISALSDEVFLGLELSKIAKEWNSNVIVLWGNKGPTMNPERVLSDESVDFVCIGEGIHFMNEFVECIQHKKDPKLLDNIAFRNDHGQIVRNKLRPFYQNLDALPYFDLSLFDRRHFVKPFDGKVYNGGDHMIYWGCPNNCTFCINHAYRKLYGKKPGKFLRCYSVDRIIDELSALVKKWDINLFHFHDEDFCLKPLPYFEELSEKYQQKVGIPFVGMANAINLTSKKVKLLKKMGCVSISVGIETGNDHLRKNILKRKESKDDIIQAVHMLNDAGIRTSSFNMLGIPFETRSTFMETVEINKQSDVRFPNIVFFYPLENTELRDIAIKNGFVDEKSISLYDDVIPTLSFPDLSTKSIIALRERFVLYVKFPKSFYKYIERSEKNDNIGKTLTETLYRFYEECVFSHNGVWKSFDKEKNMIKQLDGILNS